MTLRDGRNVTNVDLHGANCRFRAADASPPTPLRAGGKHPRRVPPVKLRGSPRRG
jgi:hypothetical protein